MTRISLMIRVSLVMRILRVKNQVRYVLWLFSAGNASVFTEFALGDQTPIDPLRFVGDSFFCFSNYVPRESLLPVWVEDFLAD